MFFILTLDVISEETGRCIVYLRKQLTIEASKLAVRSQFQGKC